ncbi:hypothetical protein DY000_02030085 [Brassica cretica]|uniref:Uncharacterized protein n=1 Tax=Brassica cretica TaxID=69181 RepID=A0ABQ7DFV4_BRACR|nr:hypothetical protein DY000_02030085 [Brassica cretica]
MELAELPAPEVTRFIIFLAEVRAERPSLRRSEDRNTAVKTTASVFDHRVLLKLVQDLKCKRKRQRSIAKSACGVV